MLWSRGTRTRDRIVGVEECTDNPKGKLIMTITTLTAIIALVLPEFMRLYRLATIKSITAPAKRKAIRECLDYYNFMWLHRESQEQVEQSAEEESES